MEQDSKALRAAVERYMAQLGALDEDNNRDIDAIVALVADDIVYEIPFLAKPLVMRGRDELRAFFASMQGMFTGIAYHFDRWLVDEERQAVVLEMRSERLVLPGRDRYANRYVLIFTLRDGLIADLREYVNPLPATGVSARLDLE